MWNGPGWSHEVLTDYLRWSQAVRAAQHAARRENFAQWCSHVQALLAEPAAITSDWPDLYAAGFAPHRAARRIAAGKMHCG